MKSVGGFFVTFDHILSGLYVYQGLLILPLEKYIFYDSFSFTKHLKENILGI